MPRSKARPKKRTAAEADLESVVSQADITQILETGEIESWRRRIASREAEALFDSSRDVPDDANGLCRLELDSATFAAMTSLHHTICERLHGLTTGWGGRGDPRQRGYGYLPGTLGERQYGSLRVTMRESTGADADADAAANVRASVLLDAAELPAGLDAALDSLTTAVRALVPDRYAQYVCREQLVAAQPNLHSGKAYLPCHLDEPLHDGFGVVIVTVAVEGAASILLRSRPWDCERTRDFHFALRSGEAYALSGAARNTCLHGVLAAAGSERRASLNLRFGLHTAAQAKEEIDSQWPEGRASGAGASVQPCWIHAGEHRDTRAS
jgi:hypothetical protein